MAAITIAVTESIADGNNAANQAHRDDRQKVEKCKLVIDGFDSDTANTQQMQQYAECVQVVYSGSESVYPETETDTYVIAGVFTLCLFAMAALLVSILLGPMSRK